MRPAPCAISRLRRDQPISPWRPHFVVCASPRSRFKNDTGLKRCASNLGVRNSVSEGSPVRQYPLRILRTRHMRLLARWPSPQDSRLKPRPSARFGPANGPSLEIVAVGERRRERPFRRSGGPALRTIALANRHPDGRRMRLVRRVAKASAVSLPAGTTALERKDFPASRSDISARR